MTSFSRRASDPTRRSYSFSLRRLSLTVITKVFEVITSDGDVQPSFSFTQGIGLGTAAFFSFIEVAESNADYEGVPTDHE